MRVSIHSLPASAAWPRRSIIEYHDHIRDQVVAEIRSSAEHLTLSVNTELAALNDPDVRDRLTEDLERRKEEAQEALQQTALWQQVLNDGIADLTADIDHDLRGRFRIIGQHIETEIDSCDPTQHWAEIGTELENAIAIIRASREPA